MELFHVHTYRCRHAEEIPDEAYVLKAIEMGADSITFTDHAPFPNNQFKGRMLYEELPEYLDSINSLKAKYKDRIGIRCGLEIEYLPSLREYYSELTGLDKLDLLLLGQHFYEISSGRYSFMYPENKLLEYKGFMEAIIQGIETGLFYAVAHPDRSFRSIKVWTSDCERMSKRVIMAAKEKGVYLEQYFSSQHHSKHYWKEFWSLVQEENKVIQGLDAHCINDIERYVQKMREENTCIN